MKKEQDETEEKQEPEDEEQGLEQEVEEAEQELDEEKFVEFMTPSSMNSSTSLGQVGIVTELRATDLEQDLSQTPSTNEPIKSQNEFKYNISSNQEEEAKYVTSEREIEKFVAPAHTEVISLGREQNFSHPEIGFTPSPSTQIGQERNVEKYVLPEKTDINQLGKGDRLEKPEVKYKPSI